MNDEDQKISKKSSISTDKFEYVYKKQDCMWSVADFFFLSCKKKLQSTFILPSRLGNQKQNIFLGLMSTPYLQIGFSFPPKIIDIFLISP